MNDFERVEAEMDGMLLSLASYRELVAAGRFNGRSDAERNLEMIEALNNCEAIGRTALKMLSSVERFREDFTRRAAWGVAVDGAILRSMADAKAKR